MPHLTADHVAAINTISRFLANEEVYSLTECEPVDVIVLAGNSILPIAEHVFSSLEARPDLAKILVICGGVGHSTELLYQSVEKWSPYRSIATGLKSQPEAVVLNRILETKYASLLQRGPRILIEDKSTNCGANAIETRKVLEQHNIGSIASMIIVQDPTMSIRTKAAFERVYSDWDVAPKFLTCPTFAPKVVLQDSKLDFAIPGISSHRLWDMDRFLDLILGEIPRLRDNEEGYGPKGKNFISHVDIPDQVEQAWSRLGEVVQRKR